MLGVRASHSPQHGSRVRPSNIEMDQTALSRTHAQFGNERTRVGFLGGTVGFLIFRCRITGKQFRSNFRATPEDLKDVPPKSSIEILCEVCKERHRFDIAQCSIADDEAK